MSRRQPGIAAMYARTGAAPSAFAICGLPPESRTTRAFFAAGLPPGFLVAGVFADRFATFFATLGLVLEHGGPDERLERGLVELVVLADVDRPPDLALEARSEQALRVGQRSALRERQLDRALVALARAEDAVMRPDRHVPLPLLDHARVGGPDQPAHVRERLPSPIAELADPLVDVL